MRTLSDSPLFCASSRIEHHFHHLQIPMLNPGACIEQRKPKPDGLQIRLSDELPGASIHIPRL